MIDKEGRLQVRDCGTPQGGVVNPLLANLFLHYAFDTWMDRTHRGVPFERFNVATSFTFLGYDFKVLILKSRFIPKVCSRGIKESNESHHCDDQGLAYPSLDR